MAATIRSLRWGLIVLGIGGLLSACGPTTERVEVIRVWSHQGQEAENAAMRDIVAAFNAAHADRAVRVHIEFFPDHQYTEKVASAAAAGDLPDVLDMDGPLLAQFAAAGVLRPIARWFSDEEIADFLPTIVEQGTVDGELYALGAFDSALVLYYDKEMLEKAGVAPPPEGEGWTWEEFMEACRKIKEAGMDPVAMHMDETADEWYTYAFSPLAWSAGGALIDPETDRVQGVLDHEANVAAYAAWQRVFAEDFADTDPVNPDPFGSGETAMDWTGHWMAPGHIEQKGDTLGAMPLPRIGEHTAAACGSWCWAMSANAADPEAAALWLRWVLHPEHGVEPIVRANGAVPARRSAFAAFPEYEEMPYRLFRQLLVEHARPRPRTPHYATLTKQFADALRDIARGADPQERLTAAAEAVQRAIDRRR